MKGFRRRLKELAMEITQENVHGGRTSGAQSGLAVWLLAWFQTPLREHFARIGKPRSKRRMELVEMLQLGGKRQLMLVVCDGQRYLVGAGGDSVQSIAEMRDPLSSQYVSLAMSDEAAAGEALAARHGSKEDVRCNG
jgi:flagellar biogenesis protein FliO